VRALLALLLWMVKQMVVNPLEQLVSSFLCAVG
jgi:hypothetical protein